MKAIIKLKDMKKNITLGIICCLVILTMNLCAQEPGIVGSWVAEEDSKWVIFFKPTLCYQYYERVLVETDSIHISNTSPQCAQEVLIDQNTKYLRLVDLKDKTSFCYEIYGLTTEKLTLCVVGQGGLTVFTRVSINPKVVVFP